MFLLTFLPPKLRRTKTNKQMVTIAKERRTVLQIIAFSAGKNVAMFNLLLKSGNVEYTNETPIYTVEVFMSASHTQVLSKCNILK